MQKRRIKIDAGGVEVVAVLNHSETAELVWDALPISASASTWGDEIYFRTDLSAHEQDARKVVEMGDIAFWPPGQALCLFFGPTPMSVGDEIRPASPVNVIGQMDGDPTILKAVPSGAPVIVEKA